MQVKWLKLKNFRNYENCYVEFFSGINLISGKNGQGKTNLVLTTLEPNAIQCPYQSSLLH